MNILFLVRRFYPLVGGVEKHVYEVSQELIKRGHNVTVITENSDLGEKEIVGKITIIRVNVGKEDKGKKFRIWKELWEYKELLLSADIVHFHDVFFWYVPFKIRFPRKKAYITFHGYEGKYPPDRKAIVIRKLSELLSSGNICIGKFIEKWYKTRADYISYGATNLIDAATPKKEKRDKEKSLHIVFIGRLEKDTGIDFYIDLIKSLKKKMLINFTIIGDGSYREEVKKVGDYKGFVKDTAFFIKSADIVFASSYLSIIDALAMKKFVLAYYDNPLKKDYLMLTPFSKFINIVNTYKEAEMYVKSLNQKLASGNTKGYNWAKQQSWEKVADLYEQLWND